MKSALLTYTAQKAVDGIKDTDLLRGFCAQSGELSLVDNWIQIDMVDDYYIDYVAVTSPKTSSGKWWFANFIVWRLFKVLLNDVCVALFSDAI